MEVWRDIPGFEGFYQASNFGRIKRVAGGKGSRRGVIKPGTCRTGYKRVVLSVRGVTYSRDVHRLVALSFYGSPPFDGMDVAHSDGNPGNNRLANLSWKTRTDNMYDQVIHGTSKGKHYGRQSGLSDDVVKKIRQDHRSESEISKDYGIGPRTVGQIRRRQTYKNIPPQDGDFQPSAKKSFSDDEVRYIRSGEKDSAALCEMFGVSYVTIWSIQTRRSYQRVE